MSNKIVSLSKEESLVKREKFFQDFPEEREHYKDWPFWDKDGYPMPDPAELATYVSSTPEMEAILNGTAEGSKDEA